MAVVTYDKVGITYDHIGITYDGLGFPSNASSVTTVKGMASSRTSSMPMVITRPTAATAVTSKPESA